MKIRKPFLFFLRNLFLSHYHKTSTDIIHKSLLEGLSLTWTFLAFTDLYLIISWFLSGLKNKKQSWEEVQVSSLLVLVWETEKQRDFALNFVVWTDVAVVVACPYCRLYLCISAKTNSEAYKAAWCCFRWSFKGCPVYLNTHFLSSFHLTSLLLISFSYLTLGRLRYKVKTQMRLMRSSHSHLSSTMLIKILSLSFPLSSSSVC